MIGLGDHRIATVGSYERLQMCLSFQEVGYEKREKLMHLGTTDGEGGEDLVLLTLFDRIVREHGAVEAAKVLGISYHDARVAKLRDTRLLTPDITNALEVFMLSEANPVIKELVTAKALVCACSVWRTCQESAGAGQGAGDNARMKMQTATEASQESLVKMVRIDGSEGGQAGSA